MILKNRTSRALAVFAGIGAFALVLSGCSSSGSDSGSDTSGSDTSTEGIAFGASKEEWQAAFADIEPIELRTQSSAAKGAPGGADFEAYLAEITEYSDGKITFDVGFSSGYASPLEGIDALNDGRLDIAHVIPQYFPEEIPVAAALVNANVLSNASSVLGSISSNVWPLQAGFESTLFEEFDELGMLPLVPYWNTGAGALICATEHTTLDEVSGAVVAASGALQTVQAQALGASPTSMPFTEFYEALQRGAVECVQTTGTSALVVGLEEVAPNVVIDPEASFIAGASTMSMSKATWDTLPLEAQQLIWDRSGTLVAGNISKVIGNYQLLSDAVTAKGGGIKPFDAAAAKAMQSATPEVLDSIASATSDEFVSNAEKLQEEWLQKTKDAGFDVDVDYSALQEWLDDGNNDKIYEFVETEVMEGVYVPFRP